MEAEESSFIFNSRSNKNQSFDKRLISHIVSLVESGDPRKQLISKYGMSSRSLEKWFSKHGCGPAKKTYTDSERRSVVRAVESGMSLKEARITFNISCNSLIS